ncbi:hypothetical protein PIB30_051384 [Stylosanthes scabra]|uniref:Uncharacterized protein n=1 Tax=Stylosanthes scabra TaxID=79078 RepID=A0ABU6TIR5_9FABA|nr:hypothetical protein [Stylosanthes scabra]
MDRTLLLRCRADAAAGRCRCGRCWKGARAATRKAAMTARRRRRRQRHGNDTDGSSQGKKLLSDPPHGCSQYLSSKSRRPLS